MGNAVRKYSREGQVAAFLVMYVYANPGHVQADGTDTGTAFSSEDGEECSSYDTNESDAEFPTLVPSDRNELKTSTYSMGDLKTSIDALVAGQTFLRQKLESMEKLLSSVNEDVTGVRGNVGLVHEAVEKLADAVSMYNTTVAVVDGVQETPSPPMPTWGTWRGEELGKQGERAERTSILDERAAEAEEERSYTPLCQDADSSILETQMYDVNTDMHTSIISLAEEGEPGEWDNGRDEAPAATLPPASQSRVEVESDALEGGCTQMELTTDATQSGTCDLGGSLWAQFASTIREMSAPVVGGSNMRSGWAQSKPPMDSAALVVGGSNTSSGWAQSKPAIDMAAPVVGGSNTSDGWVQSKRGRASCTDVGGDESRRSMLKQSVEHSSFNLNLSPENLESSDSMAGRGIRPGSRGGGRGAA